MAEEVKYNNTLVSGRADETLTYTKYVKDESSGKSTKELLDEKVNKTDQLGTTQIADKAVTTEKLENESVTTDKLDAASVTTDKVADANITTSKLADSSVETEKINNKAVTTDKLNDGAVDNSKLSPNSVTSEKIKDESIITEKLNDRAVTTEKVEEKAITNQKLGDQSVDGRVVREASLESKHFANESVTTEKIARKSITKDKLADNSVDASQVVDGSIGNAKLSPDSVTTEKIKDSSVTNEKVADDTLGFEKFDPELRKTIQAATGLPDDLSQMIQNVDKSIKQLHEKDTDLQSNVKANQQQITANKSAQDAKNASLDENMTKLNTRDDQITETLKNISATGGASVASAVTYDNTTSQLTSANIQGAVDELQGAKIDKTSILQESGEAEDKVMSQKAVTDELNSLSDNTEFRDEENNVVKTPFSMIDSPEFLVVEKDAEDKVLAATYHDGSHYAYNMKSETIPTEFYHIEDPEGRTEITTDAENNVLGYRDQEGTRHEMKIVAESISSKEIEELKQSTSSLEELKAARYNQAKSIRGSIRDEMFVDYYTCKLFPIKGGDVITIKGANSNCAIAFLTDNILAFNQKPNFSTVEGFNKLIHLGVGQKTIMSPTDARYFYWEASGYETSVGGATDFIPLSFFINGIDYLNSFIDSIATLSKRVSLLEDNHATDFISEEDAFFKKVKILSNKNMLQFFAHSDSHYSESKSYILDNASVYAKICESMGFAFQVHLGDVFDNTKNRDSDLLRLSKMCSLWQNSNTPFMYVQGNHETFYGDLTKDEIFGAASVFNKYIEIHRKIDDETSSLYFYFDNDNAKIRCFCLDSCIPSCGYSDKEVEWIKESIESLPSGYGVVMFCHIPFIREALWKNHANVPNDSVIREYLKGKVDAGLNLIAVIHGHMHWDNVVYSNDLKCPFISVASDKFDGLNKDEVPEGSNPYVPNRSANTFEQYLADSFNIDKDSDKVIAIRFGAGKDRYIHRGTLQLSDSISLPTTSIVPTKWYAKDEGLITIDNEKITKVATGNTILYAENDTEIEFWNIVIS